MNTTAKNLCGANINKLRTEANMSLSELSTKMAAYDVNVDADEIEKIEASESAVTDLELIAFTKIFDISAEALFLAAV